MPVDRFNPGAGDRASWPARTDTWHELEHGVLDVRGSLKALGTLLITADGEGLDGDDLSGLIRAVAQQAEPLAAHFAVLLRTPHTYLDDEPPAARFELERELVALARAINSLASMAALITPTDALSFRDMGELPRSLAQKAGRISDVLDAIRAASFLKAEGLSASGAHLSQGADGDNDK